MPKIEEFLKNSKKFSKTSEENWTVDLTPPKIRNRKRPGREEYADPLPSPTDNKPSTDSVADSVANTNDMAAFESAMLPSQSPAKMQLIQPVASKPTDSVATVNEMVASEHELLPSRSSSEIQAKSEMQVEPLTETKPTDSAANGINTAAKSTEPLPSGITREQTRQTRQHVSGNSAAFEPINTLSRFSSDSGATREQSEIDKVATREHLHADLVATKQRIKHDTVATRERLPADLVATRKQSETNSGADIVDTVAKEQDSIPIMGLPRGQPSLTSQNNDFVTTLIRDDLATEDDHLLPSEEPSREQIKAYKAATWEHKSANLAASRQHLPQDTGATRKQTEADSVANTDALKTDSGAVIDLDSVAKQSPKRRILPRSQHQLTLLQYLFEQQLLNDGINTPMLSRLQISKATGIDKGTLKNAIDRLEEKKLIIRNGFSRACNRGGTVYSVSNYIRKDLQSMVRQGRDDSAANSNLNSAASDSAAFGQVSDRSSSILNLNTTTNKQGTDENADKVLADRFQELIFRFKLDEHGVGANDILTLWRRVLSPRGLFKDFRDLETSLEHLAFYLGSKDSDGINSPKAWFLKQLQSGYYPEPAGFKSWEERQEESRLADVNKRLVRLKTLRKQRFEAEFEIWLSDLSEERKKILAAPINPGSRAAMAVFKSAFAEEKGIELPEELAR